MSEARPLVSVIIATYNWSSVLQYALQSVLWQTMNDFEVLVVGDACTDDSAQVVASFDHPGIHWHNLETNSGSQSGPNNAGLERARGEYVAYLGHDDIWYPTHLEHLVRTIRRARVALVHSLGVKIGPPGNDVRILSGVSGTIQVADYVWVPPTTVLHRRDLIDAIGVWQDYRTLVVGPDMDFLTRAWNTTGHFACSNELTAFKFQASWRRNSYVHRRSDEQALYVERIRSEPDFLVRELIDVATSYALDRRPPVVDLLPRADLSPGQMTERARQRRGLSGMDREQTFEPQATESPSLDPADPVTEQYYDLERHARALYLELLYKVEQFAELEGWARQLQQELARQTDEYARLETWGRHLHDELMRKDHYARTLEAEVRRLQQTSVPTVKNGP
ncbi:MAG: hypothetical protein NVS2B16_27560 [Chloroflexota bacterium]